MLYRTFWQRVAASFIDGVLLLPLVYFEQTGHGAYATMIGILVVLLHHSYYIIGHAQYGQTLGKRLLSVKVVRTHHQLPARWREAFMRELLWILTSVLYLIIQPDKLDSAFFFATIPIVIIDALIAFVHPQNRSLRDFVGKTVVVRTDMA